MANSTPRNEKSQVEEIVCEGKVYVPPCKAACPLEENIQRSHIMIALLPPDFDSAQEQVIKVGDEIFSKNPLFPLLCANICGLCEKECNYKDETGAVQRRMMVRLIADRYIKHLDSVPAFPAPSKEKVAVVGGGPGGLMCAWELSKKGYQVTILERGDRLGGAMQYIPHYRLPQREIDSVVGNLVRIANIETRFGVEIGEDGKKLDDLKKEGFKAIFMATGTPAPRALTFGREKVANTDLEGVMYGLNLLYEMLQGNVPMHLYKGKKVIVVGGGNVAFDVARTARRLDGQVTLICLENADKSSKDGIPADDEEIEGAIEEGIKIVYSRGIQEVIGKNGKFKKIKCPLCTSVFDEDGRFNPQFDTGNVMDLDGDVLLITIGQGPERDIFEKEGLLNEQGRLDIDQFTLMSNRKEGLFVGGDVRRIGFASEAMQDGLVAAESIDRFIQGKDMKAGREEKEYETASIPKRAQYKLKPEAKWLPAKERMNFEPFEKRLSTEEVIREAKRCLYCGPCKSCKGCVELGLQPEIPDIEVNEDLCSGCGVCVAICPYEASTLERKDGQIKSAIDDLKCKRCGVCISACPSNARSIKDDFLETIKKTYAELAR